MKQANKRVVWKALKNMQIIMYNSQEKKKKKKKNLLTDCSLACPPKELKFRERSQHRSL